MENPFYIREMASWAKWIATYAPLHKSQRNKNLSLFLKFRMLAVSLLNSMRMVVSTFQTPLLL
jgi:hypothetical protein